MLDFADGTIDDQRATARLARHRVQGDEVGCILVLLHVVVSFRFGVGEISHEADGRHVLLVLAPRDSLIFEEVHYRRDVDG
jgi:hypothetical protein